MSSLLAHYDPGTPDEAWEAALAPADSEAGNHSLRFTRQDRERDRLVEAVDRANRRYLGIDCCARHLAECARHSPCHMAALRAVDQANDAWIKARDALLDHEEQEIAEHRWRRAVTPTTSGKKGGA